MTKSRREVTPLRELGSSYHEGRDLMLRNTSKQEVIETRIEFQRARVRELPRWANEISINYMQSGLKPKEIISGKQFESIFLF